MPAYVHPVCTFGDLVAFDLEAVVRCRCSRHGTIDDGSIFFRPIGGAAFRCSTILPHGRQCTERHVTEIRNRGRKNGDLPDHWRATMRRQGEAAKPDRLPTFRGYVHARRGEPVVITDAS